MLVGLSSLILTLLTAFPILSQQISLPPKIDSGDTAWILKALMGLRVAEDEEQIDLDLSQHNEKGYSA